MRVLTGIVCGILWLMFLAFFKQVDENMALLTLAIIVAGGMAGGD